MLRIYLVRYFKRAFSVEGSWGSLRDHGWLPGFMGSPKHIRLDLTNQDSGHRKQNGESHVTQWPALA